MADRPLLALPDYQRIYQVVFSVLETSGIALTHRACIFFATAGAQLMREQYKLSASISAGCMALMVDEVKANVVIYGRERDGAFVGEDDAFHAWVECDGWLIDFMAPIMGESLRADGHTWDVPRRMLQKRLRDGLDDPRRIQHVGEFYTRHSKALAERLIDRQPVQFEDLIEVCRAWYRRPPKPLAPLALGDSGGPTRTLVLRAPAIEGVW